MDHVEGCPQKITVSGECHCEALIGAKANQVLMAENAKLRKELAQLINGFVPTKPPKVLKPKPPEPPKLPPKKSKKG